jgi:hypothetical protein
MTISLRHGCALLATVLLISACGGEDDWSEPHPRPSGVGALGEGFIDPEQPPAPEATVVPRPGSWDGVHPPKGYRVVLLTGGDDAPTKTLAGAVRTWADAEHVSLKTVESTKATDHVAGIARAMRLQPDLIITAGNGLVDALALVTASHLDQQFLIVGAEVPEPTHNVTAADWPGASFRGEGLGMPGDYDPATFTRERAGRAIRSGVAAVLNGITGIVLRLD